MAEFRVEVDPTRAVLHVAVRVVPNMEEGALDPDPFREAAANGAGGHMADDGRQVGEPTAEVEPAVAPYQVAEAGSDQISSLVLLPLGLGPAAMAQSAVEVVMQSAVADHLALGLGSATIPVECSEQVVPSVQVEQPMLAD